jgi:hypothetical protein
MNTNLKLLDRYDKEDNIYKLVNELSESAHTLFSIFVSSGKTIRDEEFSDLAMKEKLNLEEETEATPILDEFEDIEDVEEIKDAEDVTP